MFAILAFASSQTLLLKKLSGRSSSVRYQRWFPIPISVPLAALWFISLNCKILLIRFRSWNGALAGTVAVIHQGGI